MNYEEMLDAREGVATHRERLPFGVFYKKLIDKKYRNVVELRPELTDSIVFCEALRADAQFADSNKSQLQLHFGIKEDSSGIYELELDSGNYLTLHQLLELNPAVVAVDGYIDKVVELVANALAQLHEKGVYQYCLAPQNVFVRKSDNMPLLLCHGSFYREMKKQQMLYQGFEDYVAPEVLAGEEGDARSDVFALAKFIERLHADASMGFEYKKAVAQAVQEDPVARFATVHELLDAVARKRNTRRSALTFGGAVLVALVCVGLYFAFIPETVDVEFIKPVQENTTDVFDDGLLPEEMGIDDGEDSLGLTPEQRAEMSAIDVEVERLFRRQFQKEAESTLSKIYSKENMSASEQQFINGNYSMMESLLRKRDELAEKAGLTLDRAEQIADGVISSIRAEKQKQLKNYGYQKSQSDD